jgi:hypothetical protein
VLVSARRSSLAGLVSLCVSAVVALLASAPALAAAPEAPETGKTGVVSATTAKLEDGVLNPKAPGGLGEYEYLYRVSATECEGESATAPEPALGIEKEPVPAVTLTHLQPNAKYTFCLQEANTEGATVGAPVHFTTLAAAPTIEGESVSAIDATQALLEGIVNPNNEASECKFQYGTEPLLAKATIMPCEPASFPAEYGGQNARLGLSGLEPFKTYYYRVLASNATGTETGTIEHFTTEFLPEAPTAQPASPITAASATLHGLLNPSSVHEAEPGTDEFLYRQSATECQGENEQKLAAQAAPQGHKGEAAQAEATGLLPNTAYTFCLLVRNDAGETALSTPVSFTTLAAAPTIEEQFVTEVASTSVTLHAKIDPGGTETSYVFEYEHAGGTFKPVGEAGGTGSVGEGVAGVSVQTHVQGLEANAAYEYRIVASNGVQVDVTSEPPVTFTTQGTGTVFTLLDGRQYEMVSPPEKHGALISGINGIFGLTQASANGDGITYASHQPTENEPLGFNFGVQNLSTRVGGAWQTRDLTVPHSTPPGSQYSTGPEYRFFSTDLSHSIVQPVGFFTPCENAQGVSQPCMSPEASEQTSFLTTNFFGANVSEPCLPRNMHCAQPLVSACPQAGESCPRIVEEHADALPGSVFGGQEGGNEGPELSKCQGGENSLLCGPEFVAATPDLSHVLIKAPAGLTPEAPALPQSEGHYLYEWSAGRLIYVGDGYAPFEADSISPDGSHVIYGEGGRLLLRDTATSQTAEIAVPGLESEFRASASDESRVFFDVKPPGGYFDENTGLYVYEANKPIAERATPLAGGAHLLGVLGASEDGSYVYFVSEGVLTGSGAGGPGANLYVDHYNGVEWKPTFIAALAFEPEKFAGDFHDWEGAMSERPVRLSPNGEWLAFMSEAPLTGYDNHDAATGRADAEVYLYHAAGGEGEGGAGSLTCASCEPTGARPTGAEYEDALGSLQNIWRGKNMVAAFLPGWQAVKAQNAFEDYQSRYLSDSGRLFFNSLDSLAPDDVDGTQDVYEYEPEGTGDCASSASSGAVVFEPAREFDVQGRRGVRGAGCVGLISSGTSSSPSEFLDASETGGDVFFLTASKLAAQDEDSAYDVYDAHECTGASPCSSAPVSAPPCQTEASCRPSPTPQPSIYGLPASATFSGPGDVGAPEIVAPPKKVVKKAVKCGKGQVENKRHKCVKRTGRKRKRAGKSTRGVKR